MHRVVVTGLGIVSSIGCSQDAVVAALRESQTGLQHWPAMAEQGFRCHVYAPVRGWQPELIPKRVIQTTSPAGQYAFRATLAAMADAHLPPEAVQNDRTAVIVGSAMSGQAEAIRADLLLETRKSPSRAGATGVIKMMNSSASGNIATTFGILGRVYSLSSALATGADCIGHAYDLIRLGLQDTAICGAAEESSWECFGATMEAARGLPVSYNDRPEAAARPFDRAREGFVFSEGAGILALESLEQAQRRGAEIYAEIVGYGSANDGEDMFRPNGKGLRQALRTAMTDAAELGTTVVDYVNPHATGSRVGDPVEADALRETFGEGPWVSATKGQTGHGMGAAGAQEAIYTLLMLQKDFLAPTMNLEQVDPLCGGIRHLTEPRELPLRTAVSISVGLGGANACLVFAKSGEARR